MAKAYELRGQLKGTGQNMRLDSEGGGTVVFEYDENVARNWFDFRQDAIGKALRILIEVE